MFRLKLNIQKIFTISTVWHYVHSIFSMNSIGHAVVVTYAWPIIHLFIHSFILFYSQNTGYKYKKAQLSLTDPRDAKACQKLLQFVDSTCLQRCRWHYWPIFMRIAAVASEICEIPRNSLKIQTYEVQGHPRSSILVPIESPHVTCY